MALELKLGKVQIDPGTIRRSYVRCTTIEEADDLYEHTNHLFVVDMSNNLLVFYAGSRSQGISSHEILTFRNPIENPVGGGCIYIDGHTLVLDNYSGDYGAVPKEILLKFGEMLKAHLKEYEIRSVIVDPFIQKIRERWKSIL